jgi:hypothetical protein
VPDPEPQERPRHPHGRRGAEQPVRGRDRRQSRSGGHPRHAVRPPDDDAAPRVRSPEAIAGSRRIIAAAATATIHAAGGRAGSARDQPSTGGGQTATQSLGVPRRFPLQVERGASIHGLGFRAPDAQGWPTSPRRGAHREPERQARHARRVAHRFARHRLGDGRGCSSARLHLGAPIRHAEAGGAGALGPGALAGGSRARRQTGRPARRVPRGGGVIAAGGPAPDFEDPADTAEALAAATRIQPTHFSTGDDLALDRDIAALIEQTKKRLERRYELDDQFLAWLEERFEAIQSASARRSSDQSSSAA